MCTVVDACAYVHMVKHYIDLFIRKSKFGKLAIVSHACIYSYLLYVQDINFTVDFIYSLMGLFAYILA